MLEKITQLGSKSDTSTMYCWLFFLLLALLSVDANIELYDLKRSAVNLEGLEISFRLLGDTSRLNGHIKVEHKDCGENKFCGETFDFRSIGKGNIITIQTALDPCSNHTRIQIKASKYESEGGGLFFWTRNLAASDCKDPLDTDTEAVTSSSQHENSNTANFFTENQYQNSIILGVALLVIIVLAVTLAVSIMSFKKRREEVLNMEENQGLNF